MPSKQSLVLTKQVVSVQRTLARFVKLFEDTLWALDPLFLNLKKFSESFLRSVTKKIGFLSLINGFLLTKRILDYRLSLKQNRKKKDHLITFVETNLSDQRLNLFSVS